MYDKLIERLRETSIDFGESDHVSVMMIEAADAIERLNAFNLMWQEATKMAHEAEPKWIPVTERLPEEYEYVLCRTDYGMEVGYHRDEWGQDEWTTGELGSGTIDVSHWMPLPQPPESEGKT